LKKIAAAVLIVVLSVSGVVPAFANGLNQPVPILMYHNIVDEGGEEDALNVPVDRFEDHIRTLKYMGYNSITFEQLHEYFSGGEGLPENPVLITFDDGYLSNYSHAFGILSEYGYCATVFMITDYIGSYGYLDGEMLVEMQHSGVFDIQNHSASHLYNLSDMDSARMRAQVAGAREVLEELLDKPVRFFCYPFGRHSSALRGVLKAEGIDMAVTTAHGAAKIGDDPLQLDRIRVFGFDTGKSLVNRIGNTTGRHAKPVPQDIKPNDEDMVPFQGTTDYCGTSRICLYVAENFVMDVVSIMPLTGDERILGLIYALYRPFWKKDLSLQ